MILLKNNGVLPLKNVKRTQCRNGKTWKDLLRHIVVLTVSTLSQHVSIDLRLNITRLSRDLQKIVDLLDYMTTQLQNITEI